MPEMEWLPPMMADDVDVNVRRRTHIHDLPDVILTNIFAAVSDTRSRNTVALSCWKWREMERATRASLTLRGNVRDLLFENLKCFKSVTHLDMSLLSPYGHPLFFSPPPEVVVSSSSSSLSEIRLLAHFFRASFPCATSLTVYSRNPSTLQVLAPQWPRLSFVKLVRWHGRLQSWPLGADFSPLFENCHSLTSLDLSDFYYWKEDLTAALEAYPRVAFGLTRLNLMTSSFMDGFRTSELRIITARCPNLVELRVACTFDPRRIDFVGNEALLLIASNCPNLSILHLADASTLTNLRRNLDDDGYAAFGEDDATLLGRSTLIEFFSALPMLEDLCLDVSRNVRRSWQALEVLNTKCPRLHSLKLGQFQEICLAIESQLDGVALCARLRSLSINCCADLTDFGLIAIARGCSMLAKFEVVGCKNITMDGIKTMAFLLHKTLVEVKISCCKHLDAAASLRAVEPIRDSIQRLHIDCIWDSLEQQGTPNEEASDKFNIVELEEDAGLSSQSPECIDLFRAGDHRDMRQNKKKCKYEANDPECFSLQSNGNNSWCKKWDRLRYLSLWIAVGEHLTPLAMAGLEDCPLLEEILIKVEGDCRGRPRPSVEENEFGLSSLTQYPRLSKMRLDCGDAEGNALTAPPGQMDLSLWERFYLKGIGCLCLDELDYWVPQDNDLNQRGLSLPAAGLLPECATLRKLFIHGTANEHLMNFLLGIPDLRDAQLREDYYPAPDNDMSTEMRVDSCRRFEQALNMRRILD